MKDQVIEVCKRYGVQASYISEVIDSSRGENDQRFNYAVNHEYMLKINNASFIDERFLESISYLIENYRSINVYCPRLIKNKDGKFISVIVHNSKKFSCYMEEYSKYKTAEHISKDEYQLKKEMMWHLGKLASVYTNTDLVETRSMWSIIDLAPLDYEIDEKQENLNVLVECLSKHGYGTLANEIEIANETLRNKLKQDFYDFPRCVYQGDLNMSNILVDDQEEFIGILDFNMYGTEVNIKCFLNETMYYLEAKDFEILGANEILEKMTRVQKGLLDEIYKYYSLNEVEERCIGAYKKIVYLSFYPNVMLWIKLFKQEVQREKVLELLKNIICSHMCSGESV